MPLLAAEEVVAGGIRTDQILAAKVPVNMDEYMHYSEESAYFFEYLTRKMNKVKVDDQLKTEWMEMHPYPLFVKLTATEAVAQTSLSVDNPTFCHRDQLLRNHRTEEIYLMNEDIGGTGSSTAISVLGHTGSGGILIAGAVDDILMILGESHAEGEAIPPAYSAKPIAKNRYIMQRDSTRQNTDIQQNSAEYGPNQLLIDRKLFWIEYKRETNLLMYLGKNQREVLSASGPRRHTMSGLNEQIVTNKVDYDTVPGGLSLAAVGEIMRTTKYHTASSDTKIGICGQNSWASISAMPNTAIRTTVNETSWGKRLKTLVTPHGNLGIGYDCMLVAENGLDGYFYVLDPAQIEKRYLRGLPERILLNVSDATDIHNVKDVATGTCGLVVHLEQLSAMGFGIN